jgi:DNA ligase (NAD+)
MAIDGLGEAIVNQLVEKKLMKTPADIYRLVKEDFLTLEGFAEKSAVNLAAAINASKQNDLWRLIHALGILQVGETVSQLLAEEFGEMKTLLVADDERLLQIHGIGESMAKSIVDFFAKERTKTMLQEFEVAGVNMKTLGERKKKEGILSGKKFVLTGTLKNYTRSQAKENLESLGATVVDSVSKNIDALIAGDEAGSKLEKARSLGVKILDEEEFEKLVLR